MYCNVEIKVDKGRQNGRGKECNSIQLKNKDIGKGVGLDMKIMKTAKEYPSPPPFLKTSFLYVGISKTQTILLTLLNI